MDKRKLEKLRQLNATESMIKALKMPGTIKGRDGTKKKYKYRLAARCQQLDEILKVSICTREDVDRNILIPKWDIYINYQGETYITRERQKDGTYKWRTAMIHNLEENYWYPRGYDKYMYFNKGGNNTIKNLLGMEITGSDGIMKWQQECKKRKEDNRIRKKIEEWEKVMKPVKDPPKGFTDWYKHHGFEGSNFIYYKGAGAKTGYCTSCLKTVQLDVEPKHNMSGKCPVCHSMINYISRAKKRNAIYIRKRSVTCVQRYHNGFIQRRFEIGRTDRKKAECVNKSEFWEKEIYRQITQENSATVYEYSDYKKRKTCWHATDMEYVHSDGSRVYTKNFSWIFRNSITSYSIAVKSGCNEEIGRYMAKERERPLIEMCMKAGLTNLGRCFLTNRIYDQTDKNTTKHELGKMLCIDKGRLKRLKNMNGNHKHLMWLQEEKKKNTSYQDQDIVTLCEAEIKPSDMYRKNPFQYLSMHKVCNYIRKQNEYREQLGRKENLRYLWSDWCDYIDMMQKLKMDCSVELLLKPKDLTIAHNELVLKTSIKNVKKQIETTEKKFGNAKKLLESGELKKYEYSDEHFCIASPECVRDIYEEGITLKHCIHTCDIYFQRIDIRETYLLFLRKKEAPDVPWYTLEVEPGGNIRQKKSVLNETYKDLKQAMNFLKKWQQWVKKNLSMEDKKLAEKSDKARKDGYKQLREEKKLIWHGRLQGTLLADALENDFMEVG